MIRLCFDGAIIALKRVIKTAPGIQARSTTMGIPVPVTIAAIAGALYIGASGTFIAATMAESVGPAWATIENASARAMTAGVLTVEGTG